MHIDLGQLLDISNVEALQDQCMTVIATSMSGEVDASKIERIDAVGLQLLVAWVMEMQKNQLTVTWISPSSVFQEASRILGLQHALQLPSL